MSTILLTANYFAVGKTGGNSLKTLLDEALIKLNAGMKTIAEE